MIAQRALEGQRMMFRSVHLAVRGKLDQTERRIEPHARTRATVDCAKGASRFAFSFIRSATPIALSHDGSGALWADCNSQRFRLRTSTVQVASYLKSLQVQNRLIGLLDSSPRHTLENPQAYAYASDGQATCYNAPFDR